LAWPGWLFFCPGSWLALALALALKNQRPEVTPRSASCRRRLPHTCARVARGIFNGGQVLGEAEGRPQIRPGLRSDQASDQTRPQIRPGLRPGLRSDQASDQASGQSCVLASQQPSWFSPRPPAFLTKASVWPVKLRIWPFRALLRPTSLQPPAFPLFAHLTNHL
jgi:hypothetical protein